MSKRPAEEENVCTFFLEKKKRLCRMKAGEGMSFCPHHSHLGTDLDPKKGCRVPCPYDQSHFCYKSKLQKHLKKCNARQKEQPSYFDKNINTDGLTDLEKLQLKDVPDEELLSFIQKVRMVYNELHPETTQIITMYPLLKSEIENSDDKLASFKHMKQQASLLSVMDQFHFLQNGTCFVEFGAGKGELMYWIIRCAPEGQKKAFVLIDKSAQRHKSDNKFKDSDLQIERIRIDVEHLCLGKVPSIHTKLDRVVGVSKHLCGGATDSALRCLMNLSSAQGEEIVKHKICGLLMALCCHHRCSWNTYTGKKFLEKYGFNTRDFKLMCSLASWATCGLRKTTSEKTDTRDDEDHVKDAPNENHVKDATDEDHAKDATDENPNRYQRLNLKHEEREVIGMQCKRLIDAGRIHYLKDEGYDARLITYIDKSVSLENVAILATCKRS